MGVWAAPTQNRSSKDVVNLRHARKACQHIAGQISEFVPFFEPVSPGISLRSSTSAHRLDGKTVVIGLRKEPPETVAQVSDLTLTGQKFVSPDRFEPR